jgi:putative ABC transport system ATP-binding protein
VEPIIRICHIRKVYRIGNEKVVALDDINLDVYKGQVCCILGTSGSGKSTLLYQLAGLEKPTRGEVFIGKINISKLSEKNLARFRQKNIGFVFQSYNLLTAYTALENVSMPLIFRGVSKGKRDRTAAKMLRDVGLAGRLRHRPSQMSGGQQQRVGIARAFVTKPKIVFADEPTGNLDSKTTTEVINLMVRMARQNNQTLIIVTHDAALARYADRIITIVDGKIVSDVPNDSIADIGSPEPQNADGPSQEDEPRAEEKDGESVRNEAADAAQDELEALGGDAAPNSAQIPSATKAEQPNQKAFEGVNP